MDITTRSTFTTREEQLSGLKARLAEMEPGSIEHGELARRIANLEAPNPLVSLDSDALIRALSGPLSSAMSSIVDMGDFGPADPDDIEDEDIVNACDFDPVDVPAYVRDGDDDIWHGDLYLLSLANDVITARTAPEETC